MYRFIILTSSLSLLFPVFVALKYIRKYDKLFVIICSFLFVAGLLQTASAFLWVMKRNNLFLLHFYTFFEFEMISVFYYFLLEKYLRKWVIPLVMLLFLVTVLIDGLFIHGFQQFNIYARTIECLLIMSYAIYYFYRQLLDGSIRTVAKQPLLLINGAFLFYFSLSFFLFLFSNNILQVSFTRHLLWSMHALAAWGLYTIIGVALWKAGRK